MLTGFIQFFTGRPVVASVLALATAIVGAWAVVWIPREHLPAAARTTVVVTTGWPGASARAVRDSVAVPVEEVLADLRTEAQPSPESIVSALVERVASAGASAVPQDGRVLPDSRPVSFSSVCSSDGRYVLTLAFPVGADGREAAALVRQRLSSVLPRLPEAVQREGLETRARSTSPLLIVNLTSPDGVFDRGQLEDLAAAEVVDALRGLPGVGMVEVLGAGDPDLQIGLDPRRLSERSLTVADVVQALREAQQPLTAGRFAPAGSGGEPPFCLTVSTLDRASDAARVSETVVGVDGEGRRVHLHEVADVQCTAASPDWSASLDRRPAAAVAVYAEPGANGPRLASQVRSAVATLSESLPEGLHYAISHDTTRFEAAAMRDLARGLLLAGVLLFVTLWAILRGLAPALIALTPSVAGSLAGLAAMLAVGASANTLSLLGLVFAAGLVSADAAIIVDSARRLTQREFLHPLESAAQSASRGAPMLIAGTLAILAVLAPCAALGGTAGGLCRALALPFAAAAGPSAILAISVVPAFCGLLPSLPPARPGRLARIVAYLSAKSSVFHTGVVGLLTHRAAIGVLLIVGVVGLVASQWRQVPAGFVPAEDRGFLIVEVLLPEGASSARTREVMDEVARRLLAESGIAHVVSVSGYSATDQVRLPNLGTCYATLAPWERRVGRASSSAAIIRRVQATLNGIREGRCVARMPPDIPDLGTTGGFEMRLCGSRTTGPEQIEAIADDFSAEASRLSALAQVGHSFGASSPQLGLEIDFAGARELGVAPDALRATIQASLGSTEVGRFVAGGRTGRIRVHASRQFRSGPEDLHWLEVRDRNGKPVPASALVAWRDTAGPDAIYRYNGRPAAILRGTAEAGIASGEAIELAEYVAGRVLPPDLAVAWVGLAGEQRQAAGRPLAVLAAAALLAYLVAAVGLHSMSAPIAAVLAAPGAVLGGVAAVWLGPGQLDVFSQIGLLLLVGVAVKTALPLLATARRYRAVGYSIPGAATEASQQCARGMLVQGACLAVVAAGVMTSWGPGAVGRAAAAGVVCGGAGAVTIQGLFLLPVLFVVAQWLGEAVAARRDRSLREDLRALIEGLQLRAFIRALMEALFGYGRKKGLDRVHIVTVTGTISPEKAGTTLPHEHVLTDPIGAAAVSPDRYQASEVFLRMLDVLTPVRQYGARTLIDGTTAYEGRSPRLLRKLAEATGLQLVTNTGYNGIEHGKFVPQEAFDQTADQLAALWLAEWRHGIENSGIRPGFIKIGVSGAPLSEIDHKLVAAAARTHLQTGMVIASETPCGEAAEEQLELLRSEGVAPSAWIWVHAHAEARRKIVLSAVRRGAWAMLDGVGPETVAGHVELLVLMDKLNLLDRVLVSQSSCGFRVGERRGGRIPYYDAVFKLLIPAMFRAGLKIEHIEQITVINPMDAFSTRVRALSDYGDSART